MLKKSLPLVVMSVFSISINATVLKHDPRVFDYSQFPKPERPSLMQTQDLSYERVGNFDVKWVDTEGTGIYNTTPYTTPYGEETTLGAYRKYIAESVLQLYSLQFDFNDTLVKIELGFEEREGYLGITFGPTFTTRWTSDPYGFIEPGRNFPTPLGSALTGEQMSGDAASVYVGAYDSLLRFQEGNAYPDMAYVLYHELTHVMGFANIDCPSEENCRPEASIGKDHMQRFFVYNNGETVEPYESLDLDTRLEAMMSSDNLWFAGSDATLDAMSSELSHGHNDGRVHMHAEPTAEGGYDGQSGSHVAFDIEPYQLMASYGGFTNDLGAAAF